MAESSAGDRSIPRRAARWLPVWRRNLRVWSKLAVPSLIGNFGEPLLYLLALGYGLGALVGRIGDMPYMYFLASGIFCSSAMMTASFEATYSAYSRMAVQKTWEAIVTTPLDVIDVVLGEVFWAATKSLFSATAILLVAWALGAVNGALAVLAVPVALLSGFCFAALAMVITALARSYDFFLYYSTLGVTPMLLICGVFFPISQMPAEIQALAWALPLTHSVALARPLITGATPENVLLHLALLGAYGTVALGVAVKLLKRRLDA
ncbi:MAG TPA: ABC transporter permease [Gammaproteobacteria bacterium]|nr:ABC transporter permease [Gammaproteobacteria bacterium]